MKTFYHAHERRKVSDSMNGTEQSWSTVMINVNRFYQVFLNEISFQNQ